MIAVAVVGAAGRMGRLVVAEVLAAPDLELVAALVRPGSAAVGIDAGLLAGPEPCGVEVRALGPGAFDHSQVAIDFSLPAGLEAALPLLGETGLVTGTTGLAPVVQSAIDAHAHRAPVLQAANFSPGVNLLLDLVSRAAAALPDHDLEIVEAHHRHKRDAPSGTALAIAQTAADARGLEPAAVQSLGRAGQTGPRSAGEIGMHAVRAGEIVGDHHVILAAGGERITLSHSALSRRVFAQGAVLAARWLSGRSAGRYRMAQVLFAD